MVQIPRLRVWEANAVYINHVDFCQLLALSSSINMYALAAVSRVHGRKSVFITFRLVLH